MSIDQLNTADCCGCHACKNACPTQCIVMFEDKEGFWYPEIDKDRCVGCDICVKVCPGLKGREEPENSIPKAYAAINKDEKIRESSSSGGIFTLLAEHVLADGGIVFGAAFSEDCREVYHIPVERQDELYRLRGSKYVQSKIGETYRKAQKALETGQWVLFTGTPCQIEGLKAFLGRDYDGLLCVDIICHGVPSPKVWRKYVDFRETKSGSHTRRIFFRHKKYGWKIYSVRFEFENHTEYEQILSKDLFMRCFLADLCLRPSCYKCNFKTLNRVADITLADFWGIENILPDMNDDKGTSLVLIHSEKGACIFHALIDDMEYCEVNVENAITYNPAMIKSAALPQKRTDFMNDIMKNKFSDVVRKYNGTTASLFFKRVIRKIKRVIK